jgi:RNA polymerase sigma factor (sigma-70 family)
VAIHQNPGTYLPDFVAQPCQAATSALWAAALPPAAALPVPVDVAIEAAISAAYLEHRKAVLGYTLRMTRDADVAEDIVHEAYLRLVGVAQTGVMPDNVAGWLRRVARNLVIDWARRSRRTWTSPGPSAYETDDGPEEIVLDLERDSELHEALAHLPSDARRALLLSGAGYPSTDIAAMIGRTNGATRTLLCRARQQARVLLTAGGDRPAFAG